MSEYVHTFLIDIAIKKKKKTRMVNFEIIMAGPQAELFDLQCVRTTYWDPKIIQYQDYCYELIASFLLDNDNYCFVTNNICVLIILKTVWQQIHI